MESSSRYAISGAGLSFVFGALFPRTAWRLRWRQRLGPRGQIVAVAVHAVAMVWLQRRLGPWGAELQQLKPGWDRRLREELGREPTRDELSEAYAGYHMACQRERRPRAARRVEAGVVHVDIEVRVGGTTDAVWAHASALPGINRELWPLHMSGPTDLRLDAGTPLGKPVLRSRLTLLRVVPLDLHTLTLESVDPGEGFQEASHSLVHRRWRHARTVGADGPGVRVVDRLELEPRLLPPALAARVVGYVFERRHRVLRRTFGAPEDAATPPPAPARPASPPPGD